MEYSIQEVAKAAGTTSRTLRHYGELGLVPPSRVGANGYRFYDDRALVRLQRVLLLRDLGLGLPRIGEVLAAQDATVRDPGRAAADPAASAAGASRAEAGILRGHLELLRQEQRQLDARIGAVERTIAELDRRGSGGADLSGTEGNGGDLMSRNIFDGFDHTQYREEVEERWGADAYAKSDAWWNGLGADGQQEWKDRVAALNADWIAAAERGEDPAGEAAQALAERHVAWLTGIAGTPAAAPGGDVVGYVLGLGEMYVADERFAANYGGAAGATFVRDSLRAWAERR
ncbi:MULTISPECIES: MerR family transcriptional regulator [unclassified Leucobacter]|uniref:MerR family transcriptional regulator n=1 Tax=unclassified Leucobacter TaxID=2621730 RepID=UPI0006217FAD|nr:TipAS antibiotic-recognition domain-containing protein [Leucobacter sp. Ag1]KKI21117.1 MerR family transcriptional regulator [Leucobacter sp. Ag1]